MVPPATYLRQQRSICIVANRAAGLGMNRGKGEDGEDPQSADASLAHYIERLAKREVTALSRIHILVGGKLAAICLRITGEADSAEDALQEVYLKLWNRASTYDRNISAPMAWLAAMARNTAIDIVRAQQRRSSLSLPNEYDIVDDSPRVDDNLIDEERHIHAMSLLNNLDELQREHIRDIYLKGLTYVELAEQQGIPVDTIKSRIRRGLSAIRKAWKID